MAREWDKQGKRVCDERNAVMECRGFFRVRVDRIGEVRWFEWGRWRVRCGMGMGRLGFFVTNVGTGVEKAR